MRRGFVLCVVVVLCAFIVGGCLLCAKRERGLELPCAKLNKLFCLCHKPCRSAVVLVNEFVCTGKLCAPTWLCCISLPRFASLSVSFNRFIRMFFFACVRRDYWPFLASCTVGISVALWECCGEECAILWEKNERCKLALEFNTEVRALESKLEEELASVRQSWASGQESLQLELTTQEKGWRQEVQECRTVTDAISERTAW